MNLKVSYLTIGIFSCLSNYVLFCSVCLGWLKPDQSCTTKAKCIICNIVIKADISVIKQHSLATKHKSNLNIKPSTSSTQKTIKETLTFNKDQTTLALQTKKLEISLSVFLSEHNIAFLATDHLTKLLKSYIPDSKIVQGMNLSRTKATNIVNNVVAPTILENHIKYLKNHKFSLLIDESTDISTVKSMSVCTRFYNDLSEKIDVRSLGLIEVFSDKDYDGANEGATGRIFFLFVNFVL